MTNYMKLIKIRLVYMFNPVEAVLVLIITKDLSFSVMAS